MRGVGCAGALTVRVSSIEVRNMPKVAVTVPVHNAAKHRGGKFF